MILFSILFNYIFFFFDKKKKIDGSADPRFSNTQTHVQPNTFPISFLPDAEMPSLEEIHSITRS